MTHRDTNRGKRLPAGRGPSPGGIPPTLLGLLGLLGLCAGLAAQPQPTFRASTRLVEVAVTVVDKKGNAVTGLEATDFQVFDQGKPQTVDLFRFDGRRASQGSQPVPALASGAFTNRPVLADDAPRNVTALVLDNINTTPVEGVTARRLMMRYLKTLAPQTITAVYLMAEKLYALHDFTDDDAALRARIEKARLPAATGWDLDQRQSIVEAEMFLQMFGDSKETQAVMQGFAAFGLRAEALADAGIRRDRAVRSLALVEALGMHLAGIPGRKSVVWIGGGFSMVSVTASQSQRTPELVETLEADVRQVSRRLAQQGVVLYIVDAHRAQVTTSDMRPQSSQAAPTRGRGNFELLMDTSAMSNDSKGAMQTMASITGGRYFYPEDSTAGIDKVLGDLDGSYTLGFYVAEKPDNKWHKLKVQVKRSGLNVRHREGYWADVQQAQPARWTEEAWRSALSNPLGSPGIPLTAACKWTPSGELAMTVVAQTDVLEFLPAGQTLKASLEVVIADRLPDGPGRSTRFELSSTVPAAQLEPARKQATRYEGTWKPAADATGVRVIVHDINSGRHGSIDVALSKVPRVN